MSSDFEIPEPIICSPFDEPAADCTSRKVRSLNCSWPPAVHLLPFRRERRRLGGRTWRYAMARSVPQVRDYLEAARAGTILRRFRQ